MEKINTWIQFLYDTKENKALDIIIAIGIIILFTMISSFISYLIMRIFKLKQKVDIKKSKLYKSIKSIIFLIGVYIAILVLNLPIQWHSFLVKCVKILILWRASVTISNLIAPDSKLIKTIRDSDKIDEDDTLVKVITKFGRIRHLCYCWVYDNF